MAGDAGLVGQGHATPVSRVRQVTLLGQRLSCPQSRDLGSHGPSSVGAGAGPPGGAPPCPHPSQGREGPALPWGDMGPGLGHAVNFLGDPSQGASGQGRGLQREPVAQVPGQPQEPREWQKRRWGRGGTGEAESGSRATSSSPGGGAVARMARDLRVRACVRVGRLMLAF